VLALAALVLARAGVVLLVTAGVLVAGAAPRYHGNGAHALLAAAPCYRGHGAQTLAVTLSTDGAARGTPQ